MEQSGEPHSRARSTTHVRASQRWSGQPRGTTRRAHVGPTRQSRRCRAASVNRGAGSDRLSRRAQRACSRTKLASTVIGCRTSTARERSLSVSASPGGEVAGVLVDLDAGADPGQVELGVELGGVDVAAHPERLHRAGRRGGQLHGALGQREHRLLVPAVRREVVGHAGEDRVRLALRGQRHRQRTHRLGPAAVDQAALVQAEGADAVAGAEEREVPRDDVVEQRGDRALGAPLGRRLGAPGVAGVPRTAAEEDPGPARRGRARAARACGQVHQRAARPPASPLNRRNESYSLSAAAASRPDREQQERLGHASLSPRRRGRRARPSIGRGRRRGR